MRLAVEDGVQQSIQINELEKELKNGDGMAIAYFEGKIDGIVIPVDYNSNIYRVMVFDGFSRGNSRYGDEECSLSHIVKRSEKVLFFDTLKEGFKFLGDNI